MAEPADRLECISSEHDPLRRLGDAVAAVGPGAGFDDGVRFSGSVALGYSSFISEKTQIEDSVVMPEAWIGPGCRLKRSVIGQGVELPAEFEGQNLLVCVDPDPQLELPSSTRRQDGLLFYSFAPATA